MMKKILRTHDYIKIAKELEQKSIITSKFGLEIKINNEFFIIYQTYYNFYPDISIKLPNKIIKVDFQKFKEKIEQRDSEKISYKIYLKARNYFIRELIRYELINI